MTKSIAAAGTPIASPSSIAWCTSDKTLYQVPRTRLDPFGSVSLVSFCTALRETFGLLCGQRFTFGKARLNFDLPLV
jgi:hypothetical protein